LLDPSARRFSIPRTGASLFCRSKALLALDFL
jgi:hypothetical protein